QTVASSSFDINEETADRGDSFHISTDGSRGRSSTRERSIVPEPCYYYSSGSKPHSAHSSQSGGNLVDGQEYTRPPQIFHASKQLPTAFASSFGSVPVTAANNTNSA